MPLSNRTKEQGPAIRVAGPSEPTCAWDYGWRTRGMNRIRTPPREAHRVLAVSARM